MILRKMLLGSAVVYAAAPIKEDKKEEKKDESKGETCDIPKMKPSELPIYNGHHICQNSQFPVGTCTFPSPSQYLRDFLVPPIKTAREQIQLALGQVTTVKAKVAEQFEVVEDKTKWIVKYLREEDNEQQRYGAVAMGTVAGFIFGLRGGYIKRVWYATLGTGIMGAICFPEETDKIVRATFFNGKHYATIGYNFCYGVKPGDPQLEIKFPELNIPKDFPEFVDMTVGLAKTLKTAVMPPPSNDDKPPAQPQPSEKKN